MINVPGEIYSLNSMRTEGCDVRTVYGIEDAVDIAKKIKIKKLFSWLLVLKQLHHQQLLFY
jgi:hydrogenase expression/formation protein HypD